MNLHSLYSEEGTSIYDVAVRTYLTLLITFVLQACLLAEEGKSNPIADQLWRDGKITPDQPFKAKIVAAGGISPWSGHTVIYLKEDGDNGRILRALVGVHVNTGVQYKKLTKAEFEEVLEWKTDRKSYNACVYITPVDVSKFVYSSCLGYVGSKMGESDIVRQSYIKSKEKKQSYQHFILE